MSVNSWVFEPDDAASELAAAIRRQSGGRPLDLAVILGSGWGECFADAEVLATYPYRDWPCFPGGQIAGHGGCLQLVRRQGEQLLVFCGRFHCYQGLSAFAAAFPVRLASASGVRRILLTCATGGINPEFISGDYLLVTDHLNLLGDNPLRGLDAETFVDLGSLYQDRFFEPLRTRAGTLPARLHRGVLAAMPGPSYETPAEVRMLATLGADVVAMSTVPEAIMAHSLGMEVTALALIANPAAGLCSGAIRHDDVLATGRVAAERSRALLLQLLELWRTDSPAQVA